MLPPLLGVDYLGERAEWNAACHARKDRCCTPRAPDDPTSQSNSRKPLGARGEASRGVDLDCADLEWARRLASGTGRRVPPMALESTAAGSLSPHPTQRRVATLTPCCP